MIDDTELPLDNNSELLATIVTSWNTFTKLPATVIKFTGSASFPSLIINPVACN